MGPWKGLPAVVQDQSYTRSVQRAGGRAVLLPPDARDAEDPSGLLDLLDGLMLAGGTDLAPSSYGAEPHAEGDAGDELRDRFEIALISAALERELPLLAICRGVQVMNVARGGDVVQHLPEAVGHDRHRPVPGAWAEHVERTDPSSRVGTTVGERIEVKSHHHQGLGELGSGLRPVAWSEQDDLVEGLEDPEGYLFRTAMNVFRSRYRRAALAARRTLTLAPTATDGLAAVEARHELIRLLRGLAPRERAAIVLTAILDLPAEEAGRVLGIQASTVRALATRARSHIKDEAEDRR